MSFFKTNRIKDLVEAVRKDIRQLTTQATQSAKTYVMPESHQVHSGNAVRKDIRHARITSLQSAKTYNIPCRFSLVFVVAIRKDIRPFETFTFRSPTRNKHNHCSPQRHTILLLHFPLFSWPRHLQCAEQQVSRSNRTKYCACHAERLTYLVLISNETSFTLRGTTGVTIQPHHILRLSRKKTHILSPHHI